MSKDYYATLGVERSASEDEIKKAYKRLAKKYHPDINKEEGADEQFKKINEAASVLLDSGKRQHYDQFGTTEGMGGFGGQGSDFSGFDFSGFGGGFDDVFDAFFGGRRRGRSGPARGSDLRYDVEISLEDVNVGLEKNISFSTQTPCDHCNGSGAESSDDISTCTTCNGSGQVRRTQRTPFGVFATNSPCSTCGGTGKIISKKCSVCSGAGNVEKEQNITVTIPTGIESGTRLRVSGKGMAGDRGGPRGDLYVYVHVRDHRVFEREGKHLHTALPLSIVQCSLGTTVDVPTISGETVSVTVPAGTQHDDVLTVRGEGLPVFHGSGKGNLVIHVQVVVPKKLSKKSKELLGSLGDELGEEVQPQKSFFKKFL